LSNCFAQIFGNLMMQKISSDAFGLYSFASKVTHLTFPSST
jgi:hypothetical protein